MWHTKPTRAPSSREGKNIQEEWAEIPHYPNYMVSTEGRIWNRKHNRFLRPSFDTYGYLSVELYNTDGSSRKLVHRLVGIAFIEGHFSGLQINHIDGNKVNNYVENLAWVTPRENLTHAHRTGLKKAHGHIPVRIIELEKTFTSQRECADFIQGKQSAISECLSGRRKKHRGYTFEYVE